jgi:hypothetical protein
VLLGSTSIDVFPIHCIFHEGDVVIGGQGEVGDAAHKASYVLPICVQSNFLHSTCQEAKGRLGEPKKHLDLLLFILLLQSWGLN